MKIVTIMQAVTAQLTIINKVYVTTRRFIQGNGNIAEGRPLTK